MESNFKLINSSYDSTTESVFHKRTKSKHSFENFGRRGNFGEQKKSNGLHLSSKIHQFRVRSYLRTQRLHKEVSKNERKYIISYFRCFEIVFCCMEGRNSRLMILSCLKEIWWQLIQKQKKTENSIPRRLDSQLKKKRFFWIRNSQTPSAVVCIWKSFKLNFHTQYIRSTL